MLSLVINIQEKPKTTMWCYKAVQVQLRYCCYKKFLQTNICYGMVSGVRITDERNVNLYFLCVDIFHFAMMKTLIRFRYNVNNSILCHAFYKWIMFNLFNFTHSRWWFYLLKYEHFSIFNYFYGRLERMDNVKVNI